MPLGINVVVGDPAGINPEQVYGVVLQYPGTTGLVRDELGALTNLYTPAAYKSRIAKTLVREALRELRRQGSAG